MWADHHAKPMTRIELIPTRTPDGTVVLTAVVVGPMERLRRWARRLAQRA